MWDFIFNLLTSTLLQILGLFGNLFLFGLLLYVFARSTRITFRKSFGSWMDILFTGWIGTPVHELGHAIFCLIFGHKITEMRLYKPNSDDGTLGYVNHTYNKKNIYHRIGNFFIGIGPVIFGSLIIYLIYIWLIDNESNSFQLKNVEITYSGFESFLYSFKGGVSYIIDTVFVKSNFQDLWFYVFMYVSLSIASHMQLSPPDLKSVGSGLLLIIVLLLITNIILLLTDVSPLSISEFVSIYTGFFTGVFMLSLVLSTSFFIFIYLIGNVYTILRKRGIINPFRN
ncbi:MAG: hypothetical protein ABIJ97_15275 [Bacteroidota bacterium]